MNIDPAVGGLHDQVHDRFQTRHRPDEMTAQEMAEELAYLRAENAYLKKLDALIQEEREAKSANRPGIKA